MTAALTLALQLGSYIEEFPLGDCSPDDDPEKQYAYVTAFRESAIRFVAAVTRIGDPSLSNMVASVNTAPEWIADAHALRAELLAVIDALKEAEQDPSFSAGIASKSAFLDTAALAELRGLQCKHLDTTKLVKMCEELNDAYSRGHYISSVLLLRAIINHVPPVFGATKFSEVVALAGRSVKTILGQLTDARPIADLHTHILMRRSEHLPTKNQLEPFKSAFEVLIQEVLGKLEQR